MDLFATKRNCTGVSGVAALLYACNLPGAFSELQAAWLQIHQTTNSANPLLRLQVWGYKSEYVDYIWYGIRRDGTNQEQLPVISRPGTGAHFEKLHAHAFLSIMSTGGIMHDH